MAHQNAHTVSVMSKGRIVETGTTRQVFTDARELPAAGPGRVR